MRGELPVLVLNLPRIATTQIDRDPCLISRKNKHRVSLIESSPIAVLSLSW